MSLKQDTSVPSVGTTFRRPRLAEKGTQRTGFLIVVIGAVLLGLATDDALANAVLGGGKDDSLRGSVGNDTLIGFAKGDETWGLAGDDALLGGGGDDELYGGKGHDALLGGLGNDYFEARDGERDYVWCGPGDDVVSADLADRVTRNCETLYAG